MSDYTTNYLFKGDASSIEAASAQARAATKGVSDSVKNQSGEVDKGALQWGKYRGAISSVVTQFGIMGGGSASLVMRLAALGSEIGIVGIAAGALAYGFLETKEAGDKFLKALEAIDKEVKSMTKPTEGLRDIYRELSVQFGVNLKDLEALTPVYQKHKEEQEKLNKLLKDAEAATSGTGNAEFLLGVVRNAGKEIMKAEGEQYAKNIEQKRDDIKVTSELNTVLGEEKKRIEDAKEAAKKAVIERKRNEEIYTNFLRDSALARNDAYEKEGAERWAYQKQLGADIAAGYQEESEKEKERTQKRADALNEIELQGGMTRAGAMKAHADSLETIGKRIDEVDFSLEGLGKSAAANIGGNFAQAIALATSGQQNFGKAAKAAVASTLQALGSEAIVKAAMATAEGFMLLSNPFTAPFAPFAFKAAALYAIVGGMASAAGGLMARGSGTVAGVGNSQGGRQNVVGGGNASGGGGGGGTTQINVYVSGTATDRDIAEGIDKALKKKEKYGY